ncbi:HAD family hydrolase [Effusibacillus dendaii]|uniref:ATPase P n=1 Tax=Effusibacillus dendaii TaxID=2743772 RepID=A0A7I8DHA7_9BACL|nr:hypothetical protein [Effusibacillus dendaii]BCJ88286.1 hypothetical protein skT53_32710 [Effusibacillus dendaii]
MLEVQIPGRGLFHFSHVFIDFNGTIATDGIISEPLKPLLSELSEILEIIIVTADNNGTVQNQCKGLPVKVRIVSASEQDEQKARIMQETQRDHTIAIGNGVVDVKMFNAADVAICVLADEGCSPKALLASDIVVRDMRNALELLTHPHRLVASLRN